jgi:hypothetical protein
MFSETMCVPFSVLATGEAHACSDSQFRAFKGLVHSRNVPARDRNVVILVAASQRSDRTAGSGE